MELMYGFDSPLDAPLETGLGAVLFLEGWAFCPEEDIRGLAVEFGGETFPVAEFKNARKDILVSHPGASSAQAGRALLSGFWIPVPLHPVLDDQQVPMRIVAKLKGGRRLCSPIHYVSVRACNAIRPATIGGALPHNPRVCICMATYNPTEAMLRRQLDSIRAQDYQNWVCLIQDDWSADPSFSAIRRVIGDDPRFILERNSHNIGFYLNFERVLRRVPPPSDCDLVCLSDQDDYWQPDKLSTLVSAFTPRTTLVYSDMRIVDPQGNVLSDTYWMTRANNHTDIETLFFTNTVTGAASMFRASLLPLLLPFPPKIGSIYHDWWIALVALATGEIQYVKRPLYDYHQHAGNVIGWYHIPQTVSVLRFLKSDPYRRELAHIARHMYNNECKYQAAAVRVLRQRVPHSRHDAAINRIEGLNRHPLTTLLGQYFRAHLYRKPVSNMREKNFVMAHAVSRMLNRYHLRKKQEILHAFANPHEAAAQEPNHAAAAHVLPVDTFESKFRPLKLHIRADEPQRVNILLERIDFQYVFGGYIGMLNLARRIAKAGFRTRIVIVERTDYQPDLWREKMHNYPGLEDIFDLVEFTYHFDRSIPLAVNPDDRFIATSCWNAWIADTAARELGGRRFAFLIQEYEPYFSAHGSLYALANSAYDLDMFGIFSTEILRDFFRESRIGIYRQGIVGGDAASISFNNSIVASQVDALRLRRAPRAKRKFLFYCRPEAHAQRNLYELGIAALRKALRQGEKALSPEEWEFFGIGTIGEQFAIPLGASGQPQMVAMAKMSLKEYAGYLPDFDLGMSLMYTPHPSLVPLEMAAAGLVTVTNSYANKTPEALLAISNNFEVGPPTIDGLSAALIRAAARVDDIPARVAGSKVNWPTSWDQALGGDIIRPLLEELGRGRIARNEPVMLTHGA